jgi:hypothetical protein
VGGQKLTKHRLPKFAYWTGLVVLLTCLKSFHGLDSDEGVILEGAWGLLNGRELYTDSFQFVTPGSFYLVSWIWHAFLPDYHLAKMVGATSILFTAVAIYRTSRLVVSKDNAFSYIAPALYCLASAAWPTINHNTFNVVFLAWATYFCVKAVSINSLPSIAAAGLFAGFSTLFLQHKGIAFFLAVLLFLLFSYGRDKKSFWIKGAALYVLFFLVPLTVLLRWPRSILYEYLLSFPLSHYSEVNHVSFAPFVVAVFYVVLLFIMLRNGLTRGMRLLFTVQVALLATSLQRTDLSHTLIVLFPVLSLAAVAYAKTEKLQFSRLTCYIYGGTAILTALFVSLLATASFIAFPPFHDQTKNEALPLMQYIRNNCESFYAGPFLPGFYFEARRLNPTSYSMLLTKLNTDQQFARARAEFQAALPSCAVTNYAMVEKFGYDRQNPVDEFIRLNYEFAYAWGDFRVHRLKGTVSRSGLGASPGL